MTPSQVSLLRPWAGAGLQLERLARMSSVWPGPAAVTLSRAGNEAPDGRDPGRVAQGLSTVSPSQSASMVVVIQVAT